MRKIVYVAAAISLIAAASGALATPASTVHINGTVTQGACTPTLDNGGVVDYGNISATKILTHDSQLPAKKIQLTINCNAETILYFAFNDNRAGTNSTQTGMRVTGGGINGDQSIGNSANAFGMGKSKGMSNLSSLIGSYTITIMHPEMSTDTPVKMIYSTDSGPWSTLTTGVAVSESWVNRHYSFSKLDEFVPTAIKTATFPLKINSALAKSATVSQSNNINGNATVIIGYL